MKKFFLMIFILCLSFSCKENTSDPDKLDTSGSKFDIIYRNFKDSTHMSYVEVSSDSCPITNSLYGKLYFTPRLDSGDRLLYSFLNSKLDTVFSANNYYTKNISPYYDYSTSFKSHLKGIYIGSVRVIRDKLEIWYGSDTVTIY